MATLLKVLNNLADIKSAGVLHFASELRVGSIRSLRCVLGRARVSSSSAPASRTATDTGICSVTVFEDDAGSWRGVFGSESVSLQALGPAAYLDGARLNAVAGQTGCDA